MCCVYVSVQRCNKPKSRAIIEAEKKKAAGWLLDGVEVWTGGFYTIHVV